MTLHIREGRSPFAQLVVNPVLKFDYLAGIGSGGCSDIDMIVHKNGRFLVIENKSLRDTFSGGQHITLEALAARDEFDIWVAIGKPPETMQSLGKLGGEQRPADVSQVRRAVQNWWDSQ